MATTAWATADGFFDEGDGILLAAKAELSHDGFVIFAANGETVALWKPAHLVRTMGADGFRISARQQAGSFVFDPDTGSDLIRTLARIPEADAPVTPQTLASTMMVIVAVALVALIVLAWGSFWLMGWLFEAGLGSAG